jgi:hypothetical protein
MRDMVEDIDCRARRASNSMIRGDGASESALFCVTTYVSSPQQSVFIWGDDVVVLMSHSKNKNIFP